MGLTTQTYDIITRLAVGNGAIVYRAVEKGTMRQVALKLLTQDGDVDHRLDLDALFADAPRLSAIDGTHVCRLLNAFSDDDGHVLAYEFAPGINGAELPHEKPLDAARALDVAAQLISALRSGERQRCPHGDLKPGNIIFMDVPGGRPYTLVLDWGLAVHRQTHPDDSLPYLAPEMLAGAPPSHRADLFSAGVVLFYLYTGKFFVVGNDRQQLMDAWRGVNPSVLAQLRPDLPEKLVQWVCSLLALDPAQRPASAVEAGATLAQLGPPAPMVPPESIRPRPTAKPTSGVRPKASGIRAAPKAPVAEAQKGGNPPARRAPVTAPKPSFLPALCIFIALLLAVAGGILWVAKNKKTFVSNEPAATAPSAILPTPTSIPVATPAPAIPSPATPARALVKIAQPTSATPQHVLTAAPVEKSGAIIAIEQFTVGRRPVNITGAAGGAGWAGPWRGGGGVIDKSSVNYPNHPSAAGRLVMGQGKEDAAIMRPIGPIQHLISEPEKGGHFFLGLLVKHMSNGPVAGGEVIINPLDAEVVQNLIYAVIEDKGATLRVSLNSEEKSVEIPDKTKPVYLIFRIDLNNPDSGVYDVKATLWVNPDLAAEKPDKTGQKLELELKSQRLPNQLGIRIRKKPGQAATHIDEVRYSHKMADLVFKPTADEDAAP